MREVDRARRNEKLFNDDKKYCITDLQKSTGGHLLIIKMVYLATIRILHDKAQAVICLKGVFQSLQTKKKEKKAMLKAELCVSS